MFVQSARFVAEHKKNPSSELSIQGQEEVGETAVTCGLMVEQRTHHQITGDPMNSLTLADWTGMFETELFAQNCNSHGLAAVRCPLLEVTATVDPFGNGRGAFRCVRWGRRIVTETTLNDYAASARRRTSSSSATNSSTWAELKTPSGPCGLMSVNGDS